MYRLIATYDHPADPDGFVAHYRETHAELTKKMPKLRNFEWGLCETLDGSKPPHFLVAVLDWDCKQDAVDALGSPAGTAASADVANFAAPGSFSMSCAEITEGVVNRSDA